MRQVHVPQLWFVMALTNGDTLVLFLSIKFPPAVSLHSMDTGWTKVIDRHALAHYFVLEVHKSGEKGDKIYPY